MQSLVRPELPTAVVRSSQATLAAVNNSAPLANRLESTYIRGLLFKQAAPLLMFTVNHGFALSNPLC